MTDGWVELPIDEDLFCEKLQERIRTSTFKKGCKNVTLDVMDLLTVVTPACGRTKRARQYNTGEA